MLPVRFPLLTIFPLVAGLVGGCDLWLLQGQYFGLVTAHISAQPIDRLHAAFLGLGGFEGPRRIEGGDPACLYFFKRVLEPPVDLRVSECAGPTTDSETGWGYWISVVAASDGRPVIHAQVDELLEQVVRVLRAEVGDAKVSKRTRFGRPP
jgi:hypothetical protein